MSSWRGHCTCSTVMKVLCLSSSTARAKAVWGPKRILAAVVLVAVSLCLRQTPALKGRTGAGVRESGPASPTRSSNTTRWTPTSPGAPTVSFALCTADVIVTLEDGVDLPSAFQRYSHNGKLCVIHGYVLDQVPACLLATLANGAASTACTSTGRRTSTTRSRRSRSTPTPSTWATGSTARTFIPIPAPASRSPSSTPASRRISIPTWPTAECWPSSTSSTSGPTKYDDNGHGTHVAGVIAGTGKLSAKKYAGMAPGASLVSLKVLDQNGEGTVGDILKALDWVYTNGKAYGVRVVNLSVGAAVTESYYTDPLKDALGHQRRRAQRLARRPRRPQCRADGPRSAAAPPVWPSPPARCGWPTAATAPCRESTGNTNTACSPFPSGPTRRVSPRAPVRLGGELRRADDLADRPAQRAGDQVDVHAEPTELAVGLGAVWITSPTNRTVSQLDPRSGHVVD